jgi:hypothetical protein
MPKCGITCKRLTKITLLFSSTLNFLLNIPVSNYLHPRTLRTRGKSYPSSRVKA